MQIIVFVVIIIVFIGKIYILVRRGLKGCTDVCQIFIVINIGINILYIFQT